MHYKLTEEIIKLSVSKYWNSAKLEWVFETAYESEKSQTCLCGHYPITDICVIKNMKNGNVAEVGNSCINKFLRIDKGSKIFISIKKLKNDITKSMNIESIEYLNRKGIINSFEYKFYNDIIRKKKLSEKQISIKQEINGKFLKFTSYETNSQFSRINLILEWTKNKPKFDKSFILSLKNSCEKNGFLTDKQKSALENIIKKFKIE